MLILSALSALFAVLAGVEVLALNGPWPVFAGSFAGGFALAYLAYMGGIGASLPYAQLIKSAFDLYRGDLGEKLGYERPKSIDGEFAFWRNLSQLIYRGAAQDESVLIYKIPAKETAAAKDADAAKEGDAAKDRGEAEDVDAAWDADAPPDGAGDAPREEDH
jgi:hypothetical protein